MSINQFGLSPDERTLAFVGTVTDSGGKADVLEVQARTGRGRELLRVNRPEFLKFQSWTPDGQHVLYTRGIGESLELWMLASSGDGEPRDMHLALPVQPNPLSLSPDGLYIAYPEQITGQQLWIRPLPPTKAKKE